MGDKFRYGFKNLSWINTLFILLTPPASIVLTILWLYFDGFDVKLLLLGIFFYILSGVSITAGYHRLFSHRAYNAHPIIKAFFLAFGAAAFQNSLLKWASDHRIHHSQVDTKQDPYNIKEGFFYAHMGWILLKNSNDFELKYVRDLEADPMIQFQHKHYFLIAGFFGIILPTLVGGIFLNSWLGGIAVGALFKIVILHHSTFFINSLCHYIGNTPYTDSNTAKDSWFMALLTFGEGYHNFHHFFQADYRNGIKWFQFDPTKWFIKILEWMNLADKLKKTPEFKIVHAKLQMKLKQAKEKYCLDDEKYEELVFIKEKIVETLISIEDLKLQYKNTKERISKVSLLDLKRRIEIAKVEFNYNLNTFNLMVQNRSLG